MRLEPTRPTVSSGTGRSSLVRATPRRRSLVLLRGLTLATSRLFTRFVTFLPLKCTDHVVFPAPRAHRYSQVCPVCPWRSLTDPSIWDRLFPYQAVTSPCMTLPFRHNASLLSTRLLRTSNLLPANQWWCGTRRVRSMSRRHPSIGRKSLARRRPSSESVQVMSLPKRLQRP